mmetsp:Transcript_9291/g.16306  ORF Transcript_9291/g.16306 Transcript_9291/m.16306 type:complete len:173 (+) Transcript_9291:36-554(+)
MGGCFGFLARGPRPPSSVAVPGLGECKVIATTLPNGSKTINIEGFYPVPLPFCCATISGRLIHVSGTLGNIPGKLDVIQGGIAAETTQTLTNIDVILQACGCTFDDLVKVQIYLMDNDGIMGPDSRFGQMNGAYKEFYGRKGLMHQLPARITVGSGKLALGAQVEIDAIAYH